MAKAAVALKNDDGSDAQGYFRHPRGHIRDRVILHETPNSPKEGQFVGLNGFPFQIQYNKEIDLPRPVIEMLRTRIQTTSHTESDGTETVRNIPRFNMTIVKENVTNTPDDEAGAFACEVCGKTFDKKIAYLGHVRSHEKG